MSPAWKSLRARREALHLTAEELARRAAVGLDALRKAEQGQRSGRRILEPVEASLASLEQEAARG